MRVAFLGPDRLLDACAPDGASSPLDSVRVPTGADAAALSELRADVAVAFAPTEGDRDLLARAGLPAVLWFERDPDVTPAQGQRIVAPGQGQGVWRSLALPVADASFEGLGADRPGSVTWLGPDSARRRTFLESFETSVTIGEDDARATVAVNLHEGEEPAFEPRVVRALARGQLLVSETLAPARGIEPGSDYLEGRDLTDVFHAAENAARAPGTFRRVRLRGRRKAELFRSSTVIGRLAHDLMLELGAGAAAPTR
jgi:hypothetical protein